VFGKGKRLSVFSTITVGEGVSKKTEKKKAKGKKKHEFNKQQSEQIAVVPFFTFPISHQVKKQSKKLKVSEKMEAAPI
jgi:hypothetical protein